jgi:hypothetical protein
MDVVYAFLANHAEFSPQGRLTMVSGDIDTFNSRGFPCSVNVTLAVKLLITREEAQRDHRIRVTIEGAEERLANGPPIPVQLEVPIRHAQTSIPETGTIGAITLAVKFNLIWFPREGDYPLRIAVDDRILKTIVLHLRLDPQPAVAVPNP